jgi:hypothetical protein
VTGTPAHAGNNTPGGHPRRELEEVVVVAQRREESAQLTPISINSFDSDALDTLGISNIADIRAQVPNFLVDPFPASNQTLRLFIRGIGIADVQITQDPAVGVYLDGIYLARSTGLAASRSCVGPREPCTVAIRREAPSTWSRPDRTRMLSPSPRTWGQATGIACTPGQLSTCPWEQTVP